MGLQQGMLVSNQVWQSMMADESLIWHDSFWSGILHAMSLQ